MWTICACAMCCCHPCGLFLGGRGLSLSCLCVKPACTIKRKLLIYYPYFIQSEWSSLCCRTGKWKGAESCSVSNCEVESNIIQWQMVNGSIILQLRGLSALEMHELQIGIIA